MPLASCGKKGDIYRVGLQTRVSVAGAHSLTKEKLP